MGDHVLTKNKKNTWPKIKQKRFPEKDKIKGDLVSAYNNINVVKDNITFAGLCDWWIQERNQTIQYEQFWIDMIKEIYKDYMEKGDKQFFDMSKQRSEQ